MGIWKSNSRGVLICNALLSFCYIYIGHVILGFQKCFMMAKLQQVLLFGIFFSMTCCLNNSACNLYVSHLVYLQVKCSHRIIQYDIKINLKIIILCNNISRGSTLELQHWTQNRQGSCRHTQHVSSTAQYIQTGFSSIKVLIVQVVV